jgi:hypothetical protein
MNNTTSSAPTGVGEAFAQPLTVLKGNEKTKQSGTFVLDSQDLATAQGFGHVSKIWYKKTMSYDDGLAKIEAGRAITEDIMASVAEMVPAVSKTGELVIRYTDGREFKPTGHAIMQMGLWAGTGSWFLENMLRNPVDLKGRELYKRDEKDSETLVAVLRNGFRRVKPSKNSAKKFLWRTRKDGTLRAMLTDRFAIVDNRWFIERLAEFIPDGRLSHWFGDSDTIYGNVLIPDTIRAEQDSDYGGMLSIGNSEIGERRISSLPSIFRAICMNGCIWGATQGKGIRQVHRGKIDLIKLALEIKTNLEKQIPLLPQGIDKLLGARSYAYDGASERPLIAYLGKEQAFTKLQNRQVLAAYTEERSIAPDIAKTLFGLTNAITRAAQKQTPADWVKFDKIGGDLLSYDVDDWKHFVSGTKRMKTEDVEKAFA